MMSKVLLRRQLVSLGLKVTIPSQTQPKSFDLQIEDGTVIELKRICTWSGYADYFMQFLEKADEYLESGQSSRFLFVVAGAHSFITDWISKDTAYLEAFDDYITEIIKSHYIIERLLPQMKKKRDIVLVIDHIVRKERKKGENSNTLVSICNEIKQKIENTNLRPPG